LIVKEALEMRLMKMRNGAKLLGMIGGLLAVACGAAAALASQVDTAVVGGWITVAAGIVGIAGALLIDYRPGWAASLLVAAAIVAGLVAPGVIPAIANNLPIFFAYLAAAVFLIIAAVLAFVRRQSLTTTTAGATVT
jgi:phage-related minor tail protein